MSGNAGSSSPEAVSGRQAFIKIKINAKAIWRDIATAKIVKFRQHDDCVYAKTYKQQSSERISENRNRYSSREVSKSRQIDVMIACFII